MRLINAIFLLVFCSLVLSGCVSEAEQDEISEEAGDEMLEEAPPEEALPEEAPPVEAEEPAAPAGWGTECDENYDCDYFEMEECEYGYCVKQECQLTSHCAEDKDQCFVGSCYTEEELYAEFPKCAPNIACDDTCEGCKTGKRRCIMTGHSEGDVEVSFYICTECVTDMECVDGYACVDAFCVPGPES